MTAGVFLLLGYLFGAANVLVVQYFARLEDERPDLGGFGGADGKEL